MKKLLSVIIALVILCGSAVVLAEKSNQESSDIAVGDIITFGSYEQDNNSDNGPEAIEWIVLDVQDGKALLLSKYALDTKPLNTEYVDITWEQCTLRSWLNQDFLKAAFSDMEQSAILTTHVDNGKAQGYGGYDTTGGNDTEDQIFLLSYKESDLYFASNEDRMCVPTDYAVVNGVWTNDYFQVNGRPTGVWWLRSPGFDQYYAALVRSGGSLDCDHVNFVGYVVRPAFWLNLESGII